MDELFAKHAEILALTIRFAKSFAAKQNPNANSLLELSK